MVRFQRVKDPKDLDGFTSEVAEFNDYIGPEMMFDLEQHLTKIYSVKIAGQVAGYFDLAMAYLKSNATPQIAEKAITSNVPALLISRLAVDVVFQGYGVGRAMIHVVLKEL